MAIEERALAGGGTSWRVTWYLLDGVTQRSKSFRNKARAMEFDRQKRDQKERGVDFVENDALTLGEIVKKWLDVRSVGKAPNTVENYGFFKDRLLKQFGQTKGYAIRTEDLEKWLDFVTKEHSPKVAKRDSTSTKALFKFAYKRGLVPADPAAPMDSIVVPPEEDRRFPLKNHVWQILNAETGIFAMVFWLLAFTGLRPSEARALRWENIEYDEKQNTHYVYVEWNADTKGRITRLKSKKARRRVPLADHLVERLQTWKKSCPKSRLGLIFPTADGNVHPGARLNTRLAEVQPILGLTTLVETFRGGWKKPPGSPLYTPYDFRHFAASIFIEHGFGPKRIQQLLGHSTINLTFDHYGHLFPDSELSSRSMTEMVNDVIASAQRASDPSEPLWMHQHVE